MSLTYFLIGSISLKSCKYFLNKEISKDKQIKSAECENLPAHPHMLQYMCSTQQAAVIHIL